MHHRLILGRLIVGTAVLAGTLPLSGCRTGVVRRTVERRVTRRLARLLGPADAYSVRILQTPDAELVRGRAARVEIEGRGIHVRNRLLIDTLRLTLVRLRYEGVEPFFVSVQRSDLQVEVTEQALNAYLDAHHARYDPEIRFTPDQVHVRMVYPFLGTPTPIRAAGRLVIREGKQLIFDAETVDHALINDPGFGERFVEDRVNPLLDLTRVDFPARLESVQIQQGRLKAHGTAALLPEPRN